LFTAKGDNIGEPKKQQREKENTQQNPDYLAV